MSYLGAIKRERDYFRASSHGKTLLITAGCSFLLIGVQMIYPVLLPELRSAYGFDLTTAGLLISVLWFANAAGQLPGGLLADRFGEATTLLAAVVIAATTLVIVLVSGSVPVLFGATILFGLALGLFGVARYTVMEDLFPERIGTAVGIALAAADAGQTVLPPAASFVAAALIWQLGFAFTIPLFALVAVSIWLFVPDRETGPVESGYLSVDGFGQVFTVFRSRSILQGTVLFVIYVCIWVGFTSLYPTYLVEVKGFSPPVAAVLFGSFFAVGIVMKPLSGSGYDRLGVRRTTLVIALVSGVALAVLPMVEEFFPIAAVTILVAPILGSGTISQSYLVENLTEEVRGTGLGIIRIGALALGAVTPSLFGASADAGFFDEVFLVLAGLAGLMILLSLRIPAGE